MTVEEAIRSLGNPQFTVVEAERRGTKSNVNEGTTLHAYYSPTVYIGRDANNVSEPTAASELLNKFYPYVLAAAAFGAVWLLIPKR